MKKIIQVNRCDECPYAVWKEGIHKDTYWCKKVNRVISNLRRIPKWCKLQSLNGGEGK